MKTFNKILDDTIKVLNKGGVILYPTDTIWGIGCDATNKKAISKVYDIKNRNKHRPLIILMNKEMLNTYITDVPSAAQEIINTTVQPTTIIYNNPKNLPAELIYNNSIGIRIIKNHYINEILAIIKKPITSTSANISGNHSPTCFKYISEELKDQVDYIIPEKIHNSNSIRESRIIKINNNNLLEIIRK